MGAVLAATDAGESHLFAVFADVGVDLVEGAQHVEFGGVQTSLLRQVGVHVLVADGGQPVDIRVVPGETGRGRGSAWCGGPLAQTDAARAVGEGAVARSQPALKNSASLNSKFRCPCSGVQG